MFKKILVPVDLTDKHRQAVDIAADLAGSSRGEVTLLHVIELIPGLPVEEEKEFYQRLQRKARAHLDKLLDRLIQRQVTARSEIILGNRTSEVIRFAQQTDTDLIVLTSHRIDLENPGAGWGSLSYKIGILSQCPVLLVK
ncbi:MAG TPA: universal stress protein [Gemmataceae bacterium]|nr:universal stress protein [Gemmataceae bacterium]